MGSILSDPKQDLSFCIQIHSKVQNTIYCRWFRKAVVVSSPSALLVYRLFG